MLLKTIQQILVSFTLTNLYEMKHQGREVVSFGISTKAYNGGISVAELPNGTFAVCYGGNESDEVEVKYINKLSEICGVIQVIGLEGKPRRAPQDVLPCNASFSLN